MEHSHTEIKELIAPYVLGAVSPDEMAFVRAHVMTCEECINEADAYAKATGSLAFAVDERPLPEGFEDRVMGALHESRPTESVPTRSRRRRWSLLPLMGSAALVVVVAVLSVALIDARNDVSDNQSVIRALVGGEGGVGLEGDGAVARVVPTEEGALFVASGLDEAPDGRTYQLWFMKGGVPTSAGTFDAADNEVVIFKSSVRYTGFDAAAVTIEPAGGSELPTTDPFMIGTA